MKRWPRPAIQKFANYIRTHNLDVDFLQEPAAHATTPQVNKKLIAFVSRERFIEYFQFINQTAVNTDFSSEEIELILNELDPFGTGAIQISLVQRFFQEEITFFKQVALSKPQEIIQLIRSQAFPGKKIALQQSLAAADEIGDGYINKTQFIDAVYRAGLNLPRD